MNYIVLDLEWNQPFNIRKMVKSPVNLHGEIVQIGAVKLDEKYHILDTFKIMVSPKCYKKMHKKVSALTNITTESLQYGFAFPIAFNHFKKWCGDEFAFLTWGFDDISILRDNMILHQLDVQWLPPTYNIQIIFDNQITKENRQISLSHAMDKIGEPSLEAHDALNDAKNTVCVCHHLDMEKGLAEYFIEKNDGKIRCECAKTYDIKSETLKTYTSKIEALNDTNLTHFHCPFCGEEIVCDEFVRQNSIKFICIGKCKNNDEVFVRFKFTKHNDNNFRVSRIIYEITDEMRTYYSSIKEKRGNLLNIAI